MEKMSKIRLYMKNGKPSQLRVLPLRNTRGGSRIFQRRATFVKGGGGGGNYSLSDHQNMFAASLLICFLCVSSKWGVASHPSHPLIRP